MILTKGLRGVGEERLGLKLDFSDLLGGERAVGNCTPGRAKSRSISLLSGSGKGRGWGRLKIMPERASQPTSRYRKIDGTNGRIVNCWSKSMKKKKRMTRGPKMRRRNLEKQYQGFQSLLSRSGGGA